MNKTLRSIIRNVILPITTVCLLFLIWYIAAKVKQNELILPYPNEVIGRFFLLWQEKSFVKSIFGTLGRTLLCFVISFIFALVFAIISELWKPFDMFTAPVVSFLRAAPTVAVILVLYAFLPAKKMSVIVGFLIAFPVLYSSLHTAISSTDKKLLDMAKAYRVPTYRRILQIYLPHALPVVFDTTRSTLSLTLKVVVAAEILTLVPASLGGKIQTAYASFEISYLLAWTMLAIVLAFALEAIVLILKKIVIRWQI